MQTQMDNEISEYKKLVEQDEDLQVKLQMKEQIKLMETENRLLKSNIATMRREQ